MGLLPDGHALTPSPQTTIASTADAVANDWTLAEAKRTTSFWLLNLVFTLTWLVVFMPMVHIVSFAVDLGVPQFRAAMTISVIGFAGFMGRLCIGTISDSYRARADTWPVFSAPSSRVHRLRLQYRLGVAVSRGCRFWARLWRSHCPLPCDHRRFLWSDFGRLHCRFHLCRFRFPCCFRPAYRWIHIYRYRTV